MKTTTLALILFLTGLDLWAQTPPQPTTPQEVLRKLQAGRPVPGSSSSVPGSVTTLADNSAAQEEMIPPGGVNSLAMPADVAGLVKELGSGNLTRRTLALNELCDVSGATAIAPLKTALAAPTDALQ